jgi:glycosyltransferase involved in cell wall biosynthesis
LSAESRWICVQLGAREHYAVPRALQAVGALQALITDAWAPKALRSLPGPMPRLRARFHPDLVRSDVRSGGLAWIVIDACLRARSRMAVDSNWNLLIARNRRFDRMAAKLATRVIAEAGLPPDSTTVFAYSYASTETMERMASAGHRTVLGQIDGGPWEEQIVLDEISRFPELRDRYQPAPAAYWRQWRSQCAAATRIIVNSPWAAECLERSGIPASKLVEVPLYYHGEEDGSSVARDIPDRFSPTRPLRVLFLGQLNLRKGAAHLFQAIRLLRSETIEFRLVGPVLVDVPRDLREMRNVHIVGPVDRQRVAEEYARADVFILPTLSDGYALTQLEAQRYRLPVIASRYCGPVVRDGVNGILLPDVDPVSIAVKVRSLLQEPGRLRSMSDRAVTTFESLEGYGRHIVGSTTCN